MGNLKKVYKHKQANLDDYYLSLIEGARSKKNASDVGTNRRKLKIYSSSSKQRFAAKLNNLTKVCLNFALIGLLGSALSYFCAISLEADVSKHLNKLENQMKNREDLKSYLGKIYSWQNLNVKAQKMNFVQAKKVESASNRKFLSQTIFDTFF